MKSEDANEEVPLSELNNNSSKRKRELVDEKSSDDDSKKKMKTSPLELERICFVWDVSDETGDLLDSKVGGMNPAMRPHDVWPKFNGVPLVFMCQIQLNNVPNKMKDILGDSGLLQFFKIEGDQWGEDRDLLRIIPENEMKSLIPYTKENQQLTEHYAKLKLDIKSHKIKQWNEIQDYPSGPNCWGKADEDRYGLQLLKDLTKRHVTKSKIGGYGHWPREGPETLEQRVCDHCSRPHQYAQVQLFLSEIDFPQLTFGDGKGLYISYCPSAIKDTLTIENQLTP